MANVPMTERDRSIRARRAVTVLFFLNGAVFASWASRIPAIQAAHAVGHGGLGMLLLVMALGALVAMPVGGWLSSRVGSDKVSKVTAVVYCLALPCIPLAPNLSLLALVLFWFGASQGAMDVAMNAQAVDVENRYPRSIMSSFHALWSVGGLLGAGFGGFLAAQGLPPLPHFTLATLVLGGGAAWFFPHLLSLARPETPTAAGSEMDRLMPQWRLPPRGIFALGLISLCAMLGEGAIADWSAVYLRNNAGATESLAAAGFAGFSVAMAIGRFSGDALAARFGPAALVRTGGVLAAFGLTLALAFGDVAMGLVGFTCAGLGFATLIPMVFSAAGNTAGIAPGLALASVTTLGYSGFLIGPPLIGGVAEWLGLRAALGLIVLASLLAAMFASAVRRERPAK